MLRCESCGEGILERLVLKVLDGAYHSACLRCVQCKEELTGQPRPPTPKLPAMPSLPAKCYARDGNLYCKEDFFRKFGTKCSFCHEGIVPNSIVRRAQVTDFYSQH